MIILHAAPISGKELTGHRASVPGLTAAQNRMDGVEAALLITVPNHGPPARAGFPVFDMGAVFANGGQLGLPAPFHRPDLVVFHSTYIPFHGRIGRRLRKSRIPYIICPRGGMTRDAQQHKWLKKRIGNLLFFRKMVTHAAAVHCLTQREAAATVGWNRPVFVVGNGVPLPPVCELAAPGSSPQLRLVFIGRIAMEHKGLDLLVEACGRLREQLRKRGAKIEIYGPDYEGDGKLLIQLIAKWRLEDLVSWRGPVVGEAKDSVLRQTDVFLHTSRYEGHPMAVLEALSFGVPCLLTPGTNMADDLTSAEAGWVVEPSAAGIAAGLEKVLRAGRRQLQVAGFKARLMAARDYCWEQVAARTVQAYRQFALGDAAESDRAIAESIPTRRAA